MFELVSMRDSFEAARASGLSDGLVGFMSDLETHLREAEALRHEAVAEIDARGIATDQGFRDTATFLASTLRIDPGEASRRVRAARDFAPRVMVTGEVVPPRMPLVAQACREGVLSTDQARVIAQTVDALPDTVDAGTAESVEAFLVKKAEEFDPSSLRKLGRHAINELDPDAILRDVSYRERMRELVVAQRTDGSAHIRGELTSVCAEALLTVLDTLARPKPAEPGCGDGPDATLTTPDLRTAGQRRHDGLQDALTTLLRSEALPDCGGVSTTIIITATAEQMQSGDGLVLTGHGALMSASTAKELMGDAQVQLVKLGPTRAIEAYSSTQRVFTAQQRLAMIARDKGCSIPGCSAPPLWCQGHHILEYAKGGPTTVANGTLLCGDCHRQFAKRGWECVMIDGLPQWRPPPWIDPDRNPLQNHTHDPDADGLFATPDDAAAGLRRGERRGRDRTCPIRVGGGHGDAGATFE